MIVGCCRVVLALHGVDSLKEKRSVVKTVLKRTTTKFHAAGGETGEMDRHRVAELGFAIVGNDRRSIDSILNKILNYIEELGLAEVTAEDMEILDL